MSPHTQRPVPPGDHRPCPRQTLRTPPPRADRRTERTGGSHCELDSCGEGRKPDRRDARGRPGRPRARGDSAPRISARPDRSKLKDQRREERRRAQPVRAPGASRSARLTEARLDHDHRSPTLANAVLMRPRRSIMIAARANVAFVARRSATPAPPPPSISTHLFDEAANIGRARECVNGKVANLTGHGRAHRGAARPMQPQEAEKTENRDF